MRYQFGCGMFGVCLALVGCASENQDDPDLFVRGDPAAEDHAAEQALQELARPNVELMQGIDAVRVRKVHIDHLGMAHTRLTQTLDGLPVFGGDAVVHLNPRGDLRRVTDNFVHDLQQVDTQPAFGPDKAMEMAVAEEGGWMRVSDTPESDLMVMRHEGQDHLVYRVRLPMLQTDPPAIPVVFVDAHDGKLVWSYDDLQIAKDRNTYDANNGSSLPGTLSRDEGDAAVGDDAIDDAHDNAGITWDCYDSLFGRDSYDDAGASLDSTAHYLSNYNNAFWNGSQMVYGDGDGTTFSPLSGSLDVVAHELTHAVTDSESDLIYANESGALNEAMSDIFGAACEEYSDGSINSDTWKIGDEIYTPGTAGDALRYMDDPTADGSSYDYYPTRYTGTLDNGGVHWNSGIANLAFYLLSEGGTHPSGSTTINVTGIGFDKAVQIFYRANTIYLTASSDFEDARDATANSASDLYTQTEVDAVHEAWDAVGVPGNGNCGLSPGDYAYCLSSECGPCAEGEGDCDNDSECASGLICATDVGANYGWNSDVDVCESAGSSCNLSPGDWDYCLSSECGPCAEGEGDCDGDAECASGLICAQDVGPNYGWAAAVDVCEDPSASCPWSPGDWNYCRDCGPCGADLGDCDGNSECQSCLTCVNDVGPDYGWGTLVDVCR
ncbi:MAG: M4 family metallopeptidase [Myxococcales bacterium]|nr:M4 family metallopeptidase [Myxococcales bacterium]